MSSGAVKAAAAEEEEEEEYRQNRRPLVDAPYEPQGKSKWVAVGYTQNIELNINHLYTYNIIF